MSWRHDCIRSGDGNNGNDRFVFEPSQTANEDMIEDFQRGDLLDRSAIDANSSAWSMPSLLTHHQCKWRVSL
jgi:hypothetical protein